GEKGASPRASIPAENALAPGVDVRDQQQRHKDNDLHQHPSALAWLAGADDRREDAGPGIEENDVHVDDQEDHGDDVEADVEAPAGGADGDHTAFEGAGLDLSGAAR